MATSIDQLPNYLQEPSFRYKMAQIKKPVDVVEWVCSNFYLYDTGNLITLADCQKRPLAKALERDANGNYRYNTILWSWPKKSAKSSVIAAVGDFIASTRTNASVKLVANDLKQADSRVGYYLRESIRIGTKNQRRSGITVTPSGYKVAYSNGSRVECVPIDPSGEAGGNDDMIVYSELWGWKSKAHQRMWSEMTLSPNKFGNSQRWIDTYAGIRGESPILEQLYDVGVKQGRRMWDDLEVYENEAAKMLTVWVTKPMMEWQLGENGQAYYAEQAATLTPSEFDRMHRNQWAESSEAFINIEWWDNCKRSLEPMADRTPCILALDAAVESDCFALAVITVRMDGVNRIPQVRYVRIWKPEQGRQIQFAEVETEIRRLIEKYAVIEVCFDPYMLQDMAQRLSTLAFWKPFTQAGQRLIADKMLYDLIRDGRIEHDGDTHVREHMTNADRKPEDDKLRIIKRSAPMKIDAVISISMGVNRALYYQL